jgi:hypothetical protein
MIRGFKIINCHFLDMSGTVVSTHNRQSILPSDDNDEVMEGEGTWTDLSDGGARVRGRPGNFPVEIVSTPDKILA